MIPVIESEGDKMIINNEFNKLDNAELKLAEFLNKFKNKVLFHR